MPAPARSTANTRVFVVLQSKLHTALVKRGQRKISVWFRENVSELMEHENLRTELRRFYRRHSAFFSEEVGRTGKQMELHVQGNIPEFLQSLSFAVLGHGNISFISRVILYQFAVKNRWLAEPPVAEAEHQSIVPVTASTKYIAVAAAPDRRFDRRRQKLTIDTLFSGYETTQKDIDAIARLTRQGKCATIRYMIEQSISEDNPEKVKAFFLQKWVRFDAKQRGVVRIRYRIPKRYDDALHDLSDNVLGYENRSLILRTITAYMAVKLGVRKS